MGYYVTAQGTITWDEGKEHEILTAMNDLNHQHHLKSGQRWPKGGDPYEDTWYAWMPSRYHEEGHDIEGILELIGYRTDRIYDSAGIVRVSVHKDDKIGDEAPFLATMAAHGARVNITYQGEDGAAWLFRNMDHDPTVLGSYEADITYSDIGTPVVVETVSA